MRDEPIKEVDTRTMLDMKFGKGTYQAIGADCQRLREGCEKTQRSKTTRERHPLGTLVMQIPAILVMQDTLKGHEFWFTDDGQKRLATFWNEFPAMRRVETKTNPFGKTGFFARSHK